METVRSTCPYCGVGCGIKAQVAADGTVEVQGDETHAANRGRLCSKGAALGATVGPGGRLLEPVIDGRETGWDEALDHVARRFAACVEQHGPDSVAFYVSGQLLTEDYYVVNKLAKGYIGTANIDTNSRLCMASAVAGHQRAFGEDLVPVSYDDLELAELIVLVGSNLAWCHPVLKQRIDCARAARPALRLVVIDPRRTASCEEADLHLALRPGSDVMLFNGLLVWLARNGHLDEPFVGDHTHGIELALAAARAASSDVDATAQACGLSPALVQKFFELFGRHPRAITLFSQGVNQSSAGTDKVNAIINCHLLTGRIGKPGAGPFSITGQPNAMGGREVGGMASQLAAHLSLDDAAHRDAVQKFWNSPRIAQRAGLKAVDLFDAMDAGRIRAVWIIATNPVVSLPDADVVRRALRKCDFVVVSDCVADTDTTRLADVLLPASGWGEKDGTVTNSERLISRQRPFLASPGKSQPDWWIISEVARRMGFRSGFGFQSPAQIFDEHARLTGVAVSFGRRLDLTGLAGLDAQAYDDLEPRRWPVSAAATPSLRLFDDGVFPTPNGRARFVPTAARLPWHSTSSEYPLVLNTGRIRDQWHTMTRTARAPQLNAHEPEPFVDLQVDDARQSGVMEGQLAQISSRWGSVVARVRCSGDVPRGSAFIPMHWNNVYASHGRVGAVVNPVVDLLSGEPEFKHTPVRIAALATDWQGFLLIRTPCAIPKGIWWVRSGSVANQRYELEGSSAQRPDARWLLAQTGSGSSADIVEYEDQAAGIHRLAVLEQDRLIACLFIGKRQHLPRREWLCDLFEAASIDEVSRLALLTGRAPGVQIDPGPIVCACFRVGRNSILQAANEGHRSVAAIGSCLRAGTNCGSCRPEIQRLLNGTGVPH